MGDVQYRIEVEQDDTPVRGNAQASGDEALDRAAEDEIFAQLDNGNVWAWAAVTVVATLEGFEGRDHLGGCSYKSEEDFKSGGYYADMCNQARDDLLANIEDTRVRLARVGST